MAAEPPLFITLEGGEGAGKTTQIVHLADYLAARGIPSIRTREPGGTVIGTRIRAVLLDPDHAGMAPQTELLLYMADRAEHIQTVIRPALEEGTSVLCDRFFDATIVYQGTARGLSAEWLQQMHELLFAGLKPDLTLLLDLAPETGLARARRQLAQGGRASGEGRFEAESLEFHQRVRKGYLGLAHEEPGRFRVIDAGRDADRVRQDIQAAVDMFLSQRGDKALRS
ncbi:MAG: dTMP kinase [Desulfobacterales bacterium]|jgi:dTMP kinase|nr:dTMP kinase [Desulfobacterales bacterium]